MAIFNNRKKTSPLIHLFFILFGICCILPFLVVLSASLTSESNLARNGFSILPYELNLDAYEYIFKYPKVLIDAYGVTIFVTLVGTFFGVLFMSMTAYCLSRRNFMFKGILTFYVFFPTLFGGGLVPAYIINSQYLKLTDNIWVLILPGLINVFHLIMIRTFFKQIPESLFEAAKIDGASEFRIYFQIALSLSKPVLATVAFLGALARWNEWYLAMLYIRSSELMPLQYLLQIMMMNIRSIIDAMDKSPSIGLLVNELPGENLRMAMTVVAIGPMLIFFPFFQKYFTKGLTVGSVKG